MDEIAVVGSFFFVRLFHTPQFFCILKDKRRCLLQQNTNNSEQFKHPSSRNPQKHRQDYHPLQDVPHVIPPSMYRHHKQGKRRQHVAEQLLSQSDRADQQQQELPYKDLRPQ